MDEPVSARIGRGQRLAEVVKEDLELYGAVELAERIDILKGEIARCEAQLARKSSSRAAADALFGNKS